MLQIFPCHLVFGLILIVYGVQVCPFLENLGYGQAFLNTYVPILLVFPARRAAFMRARARMLSAGAGAYALYALPWREFIAELLSWLLAGLLISCSYMVLFEAPAVSAVKVLAGCLSFGLLGGMLCHLSFEKRLIDHFRGLPDPPREAPQRLLSVSRKMFFFMATVLLLMAGVMLLMVFMDIDYLLEHGNSLGEEIYSRVLREMGFAFGVLLLLSAAIIGRYSRNLRAVLGMQLEVMEEIGKGNYASRVPIVSNDEFGLIAATTNAMIQGLEDRDFCKASFGRYMAPEVSEKILRGEVPSQGEIREATILFCDLRGYTPLVERSEPREVVAFLNEYFTEMEQAVRGCNGIVLQYIGDEIEAVFGAPDELPDHADMAVKAALEMRSRLMGLNRRRTSRGEPAVAHGIGIHTGEVLAGSVGSPDRLVYAMVGDAVNVASRIQNLNKRFGTDILVSRKTRDGLKDGDVKLESLGKAELRGKRDGVEIFRLL